MPLMNGDLPDEVLVELGTTTVFLKNPGNPLCSFAIPMTLQAESGENRP